MPGDPFSVMLGFNLSGPDPSRADRLVRDREQEAAAELEARMREKAAFLQAKLDALRPQWIALQDGEMPSGQEGDVASFYCQAAKVQGESGFVQLIYLGQHRGWCYLNGLRFSGRSLLPKAYLALRREHVQAALGKAAR